MNYNTRNSSGGFLVGKVFTSKVALQDVVKLYSIKVHQQYVVVASSKKLIVLRCKKAEEVSISMEASFYGSERYIFLCNQ